MPKSPLRVCLSLILATALAACGDDSSGTAGTGGSAGVGGSGGDASTGGSAGVGSAAGNGGAGGGEPLRPDLTVKSITLVSVMCPGGGGTCVTTVDIAIENIGEGDASAYNFEVTLDSDQSVVVSQAVPSGIAAGITQLFTIMTAPGDNCYDPDCTISVVVDDLNQVIESDETNNMDDTSIEG
jgi:hypothetical protein